MTEKPIAWGYVRLRDDTDDQELILIEDGIFKFAEAHGLRLTHTYYEEGPGISPSRLVRRLIREDVRHVIVPSLVQITEHPLMQLLVSEAITLDAGALLYETSEVHGRADVR
ncbi:hypothetical protein GTZ78_08095 [Streptomyces sp. SID8361]|uniref:hypothetical protein n=1 Tax=Streptomyces sp. MnatMP-M27 TaxID=1839768 RepID=UPI00081DDDC5|nr:hypothetical protein [Streptomyces sp. MnatMP-M27]MYU10655.1 hypothetical protein [Streptomyces sp. SID8361]SCF73919.1 hypothetical protein GA0115260_1020113 [Streptomyces sp. MnatMP-M27]